MYEEYQLPASFLAPLYRDYLEGKPEACRFYNGHYKAPGIYAETAEKAAVGYDRDRKALVEVLRQVNSAWGATGKTLENLEKLARPDSVVVVAGQQAGLLGGPLYTVYKALGAIHVAARLEKELRRPVVPVFWVASEDHDFNEVKDAWLMDGTNKVQPVTLALPYAGEPVGSMPLLQEAVYSVLARFEELAPETEFKQDIVNLIRDTGQGAKTPADWFGRLMAALFSRLGLVLFDPLHPGAKNMLGPFLTRVVDRLEECRQALAQREAELAGAGYDLQVERDPQATLLMHMGEKRTALLKDENVYRTRDGKVKMEEGELVNIIRENPQSFSPNVLLRPLAQDYLFPTVCQLAGPGETAYFAQLMPLYRALGISAPVLLPRTSVTVVEPRAARYLEKYRLTVGDVLAEMKRRKKEVLAQSAGLDPEAVFGEGRRRIQDAYAKLKEELSRLDKQLANLADKNLERLFHEMGYLEKKTGQVLAARNETVLRHLDNLEAMLLPLGRLQERVFNIFMYLVKYGPEFFRELCSDFPAEPGHYLFYFKP